MYSLELSKQAQKDKEYLKAAHLDKKARELLSIIAENPFKNPPPYEVLVGNLKGFYSRRINYQHRLVYEVLMDEHRVFVVRMWSHYE